MCDFSHSVPAGFLSQRLSWAFSYEMPLWCIQLALYSVVHSVGLYLLQIFVAQSAQKEVNMSQFDFIRVGGGAV